MVREAAGQGLSARDRANVAAALGCSADDVKDACPLESGLMNTTWRISVKGEPYVYRRPGVGTQRIVDRRSEAQAERIACRLDLDHTFIHEDAEEGWKVARYASGARTLDPHDDAELAAAMRMAAHLHAQTVSIDRRFEFVREAGRLEKLGGATVRSLLQEGDRTLREQASAVGSHVAQDGTRPCLAHNDLHCLNILVAPDGRMDLIDWEYAGMSDYADDLGSFAVCSMLSPVEVDRMVFHYFGRPPRPDEMRHCLAHVGLAGWFWYVWATFRESQGEGVGAWRATYRSYAEGYLARALDLYRCTPPASGAAAYQERAEGSAKPAAW